MFKKIFCKKCFSFWDLEACWKTSFDILCALPGHLLSSGMVNATAWLFFAHRGARLWVLPTQSILRFLLALLHHLKWLSILTSCCVGIFPILHILSQLLSSLVWSSYMSYFHVKSHLFLNGSSVFIREQGNFCPEPSVFIFEITGVHIVGILFPASWLVAVEVIVI